MPLETAILKAAKTLQKIVLTAVPKTVQKTKQVTVQQTAAEL